MTRYRYRAGELLVHADDCVLIHDELAGEGYRPRGGFGSWRRFVATAARLGVPGLVAAFRARGLRVGPHHTFTPSRTPWHELWPLETSESLPPLTVPLPADPVRVGVIDTGVVLRQGRPHAYLDGRVCYDDGDVDELLVGDPVRSDSHGTFVAGVIVQEAPLNRVVMKGVLDKSSDDIEDQAVAHAIAALGEEGITLINLSFSGSTYENEPPQAIYEALNDLSADTVVVAAASNSGLPRKMYPAAIDLGEDKARIIAVGATDNDRKVADFSGYGSWVDCYAPGVGILGPFCHEEWKQGNGTSFSAAIVTGRIAALMSEGRTALEAAKALVDDATDKIPVWDVNGRTDKPFVDQLGRRAS